MMPHAQCHLLHEIGFYIKTFRKKKKTDKEIGALP